MAYVSNSRTQRLGLAPARAQLTGSSALPKPAGGSAVESWENEGGRLSRFTLSRRPIPSAPEPSVTESDRQKAEIDWLTHKLADDFAHGRVGKRYSTYQHRSRVIRQLAAIWKAGLPCPARPA